MAALILMTKPDGTVQVAVAQEAQIPPELMQDAETLPDVASAAQAIEQVLGEGGEHQGADQGAGAESAAADASAQDASQPPGASEPDEDNAMAQGFNNARKGL